MVGWGRGSGCNTAQQCVESTGGRWCRWARGGGRTYAARRTRAKSAIAKSHPTARWWCVGISGAQPRRICASGTEAPSLPASTGDGHLVARERGVQDGDAPQGDRRARRRQVVLASSLRRSSRAVADGGRPQRATRQVTVRF